jgi:hypothetical protein
VHECAFCGWERPAASPTVLSPGCPRCGCMLRSVSAAGRAAAPAVPEPASREERAPGRILAVFGRLTAVAVMLAATQAGWVHGGPFIAMVGFSLAGLATLPLLIPDSE